MCTSTALRFCAQTSQILRFFIFNSAAARSCKKIMVSFCENDGLKSREWWSEFSRMIFACAETNIHTCTYADERMRTAACHTLCVVFGTKALVRPCLRRVYGMHTCGLHTYPLVRTCMRFYWNTHTHVYIWLYIYTHTNSHSLITNAFAETQFDRYIHTYIHTHIYIYIHIYTYIYTYTKTV